MIFCQDGICFIFCYYEHRRSFNNFNSECGFSIHIGITTFNIGSNGCTTNTYNSNFTLSIHGCNIFVTRLISNSQACHRITGFICYSQSGGFYFLTFNHCQRSRIISSIKRGFGLQHIKNDVETELLTNISEVDGSLITRKRIRAYIRITWKIPSTH